MVFGSVVATSASIYIPWTYPSQIPVGGLLSYAPVINTLNVNYQAAIGISSPVLSTFSTLVNVSTNYIQYYNGSPYVTGIVLSKLAGTSGISSIIFPGDSVARNAYINYNTVLANISSSVNNTLTVWYTNINPSINPSTVNFSIFLTAGPPSAPRNLTLNSITSSAATANWINPLSNDINDATTALTISSYNVAYGTPGSALRYGGPVADLGRSATTTGAVTTFAASSLFPDSVYTFGVQATNTAFQRGVSSYVSSITSPLNPVVSAISGTIPLASRYYNNGTVKNILSNTSTLNLINISTPWTATVTAPIQTLANRASTGTALMSLSTVYTNNSVSTIGPTLTYGGFGTSAPATVTQSNISLSSLRITDSYVPTSQQGFYQQASTSITLDTGIFVPSQYDYILSLKQYQGAANTGSQTFTFQYDTLITAAPRIIGVGMNFSSLGVYYSSVTGVNVIFGQPVFTVSTIASTMGNYYYSAPVLTYTGVVGYSPSSETNLANVIAGSNSGAFTNGVITVRNISVQSGSHSATYSSTLSMNITANNILSSSPVSTTSILAIVDGPSVTLVYTTLAQTLQNLVKSVVTKGYRVGSGSAAANGVPPYTVNGNGSTTYASIGYDNRADITGLEELQVANGKFATRSSGQSYAYLNYASFYYDSTRLNTANYSGISSSGYRYVTFAWRFTGSTTYGGTIQFTLNGTSGLATGLQLFYRTEDASSPNPINPGPANYSSSWINGVNNTGQGGVTAGNYWIQTDYTTSPLYYGWNSTSSPGGSITYNVSYPNSLVITTQSINLYCRIGVPMNSSFSFTFVTATVS